MTICHGADKYAKVCGLVAYDAVVTHCEIHIDDFSGDAGGQFVLHFLLKFSNWLPIDTWLVAALAFAIIATTYVLAARNFGRNESNASELFYLQHELKRKRMK